MELNLFKGDIKKELENFLNEDFGFLTLITLVSLEQNDKEIISLEISKELDEVVLIFNNAETTRLYFDLEENDIDYIIEKCIIYYNKVVKACESIVETNKTIDNLFD